MKFISVESFTYAGFNELISLFVDESFINKNFELKKSVRICYVVKKVFLDWTRYAIAVRARQSHAKKKNTSVSIRKNMLQFCVSSNVS